MLRRRHRLPDDDEDEEDDDTGRIWDLQYLLYLLLCNNSIIRGRCWLWDDDLQSILINSNQY